MNFRWSAILLGLPLVAAPAFGHSQIGPDIDGPWYEQQWFGYSVSASANGSRVAVGGPGWNNFRGRVHVFEWDGSSWAPMGQSLEGAGDDDQLGTSVSLSGSGTRLAIGAPQHTTEIPEPPGYARVYEWDGTSWLQLGADLVGQNAGEWFGRAVALSQDGNRIAVGAPHVAISGGNYARVFEWDGTVWAPLGQPIPGEAGSDFSGVSVSLSSTGHRVAIGASANDGSGASAGHARVHEWSGSAWVQLGQDLDGEAAGDRSGQSVSLSGSGARVAIGAFQNDGAGPDAGQVRVYRWDGAAWIQLGQDLEGAAEGDLHGWSVSLSASGNRLAAGAYVANDYAGQTRIYDWSGGSWGVVGQEIDGESMLDRSGWAVALARSGNRVAIGAPWNIPDDEEGSPVGGELDGHVRVYGLPEVLAVPGEASPALAIERIHPNPSAGRSLAVHFTLPDAAAARLELLDLHGRRVAGRKVEPVAGRHSVRLTEGRGLAPGLYWLHLAQGARHAVQRVVVLE